MTRTIIPMPILRKDQEIIKLEAIIQRTLTRYYAVAPAQRSTFFLNNIIANARRNGQLLPGKLEPK